MCYGMGCVYERWDGECSRKSYGPCPHERDEDYDLPDDEEEDDDEE